MVISDPIINQFMTSRVLMLLLVDLNNNLYHIYHKHHAEKYSDVPLDELAQAPLTF
jgi:hypothetical protein